MKYAMRTIGSLILSLFMTMPGGRAEAATGDALVESSLSGGSIHLYRSDNQSWTALAGSLGNVTQITALPSGDALIACDVSGGSIWRYDSTLRTISGPLMSSTVATYYMAVLANGDALVAVSKGGGEVWLYKDQDHSLSKKIAGSMSTLSLVTALPNGNGYFSSSASSGSVYRYVAASESMDGPWMTYAGTIYQLTGLSDNKALFAISDSGGSVWMYRPDLSAKWVASGSGTTQQQVALPGGDALIGFSETGGSLWRYDAATETTVGRLMSYAGTFQAIGALSGGDALVGTSGGSGSLYIYNGSIKSVGSAIGTSLGTFYRILALSDGDALVTVSCQGGSVWRYDAVTRTLISNPLDNATGTSIPITSLASGDGLWADSTGTVWQYDAAGHGVTAVGSGMGSIGEMAGLAASTATTTSVGGTVALKDFRDNLTGEIITFSIYPPGTTNPVETHSATLGQDGSYQFQTNLFGIYDLIAKGSHWLSKACRYMVLYGSSSILTNSAYCQPTTGRIGNGIEFLPGNGGYLLVPHTNRLTPRSGLTIEAWVREDQWNTQQVVAKEPSSDPSNPNGFRAFNLAVGTTGEVKFGLTLNETQTTLATSGGAVSAGTGWTHLAATYNGATMIVYVNGVEKARRSASGAIYVTQGPLVIGNTEFGFREQFAGAIDEVYLWNRARSAAEITQDMATPPAYTASGLIVRWSF